MIVAGVVVDSKSKYISRWQVGSKGEERGGSNSFVRTPSSAQVQQRDLRSKWSGDLQQHTDSIE